MKHLLACVAVCGFVLSANTYADIVAPVPLPGGLELEHVYYDIDGDGNVTPGDGGAEHLPLIYSDTGTIGSYFPGPAAGTPPHITSDDLHMTGGLIGDFSFEYFSPNAGSATAIVSFYANTAADGISPPSTGGGAALVGGPFAILVPLGFVAVHVDLAVPVATGADIWFEVDYSGDPVWGPLITGNPGGAVGISHDVFGWDGGAGAAPGLYGFAGGTWADFKHQVGVPEPAALTLLAVGALFALRRRR